jgi:hypothetical protein
MKPIWRIIVTICMGIAIWATISQFARDYWHIAEQEAHAYDNFKLLVFPQDKTPEISVHTPLFTISNSIPVTINVLQNTNGRWAREMAIVLGGGEIDTRKLPWQPLKTNFIYRFDGKEGRTTIALAFRYHWNYRPFVFLHAHTPMNFPALQMWNVRNFFVETNPLIATIDNPKTNFFTKPIVQLQGYVDRPLNGTTGELFRADNTVAEALGFPISNIGSSSTPQKYWFQFFDLQLQPGTNRLFFRVKDDFGRSFFTNLTFVYDPKNGAPPTLQIDWPEQGATLVNKNFTVRGHTDAPGVKIQAQIVGDGKMTERTGVTGRNGEVWVDDVPLLGQTNLLTLIATDDAGNIAKAQVTIFRNDFEIKIDPYDKNLLRNPTIRLTGTISEENYSVFVNGVRAKVEGKKWIAENVPVSGGGEATFHNHQRWLIARRRRGRGFRI